jgi:hypothetical protein
MWDGWETAHSCTRRLLAELRGYQRIFNKASTTNWGTKLAALDMSRQEFEKAPTWYGTDAQPIGASETIPIALTRH